MRWVGWAVGALLAAATLVVAVTLVLGWTAFGARVRGGRLARIQASPQWSAGQFVNPQPLVNDGWGMVRGLFSVSADATPRQTVPVAQRRAEPFDSAPPGGLRVTWFGHSSTLVEIDGHRVLTDPMWGERASPVPWVGPARWYPPPVSLEQLPALDAVVISHDHYDHLDRSTIVRLNATDAIFVVPLGIGAHLESWGVAPARIVELDWWQSTKIRALTIVCTPARHASGRMLVDNDSKLWAGYALLGPRKRVYYSGDTGLFPGMREIGRRLGPFDLTMIESGQYDRSWPDWHLGPEQAVQAHQLVGGRVMLPVHWGLFTLAYHGWTEPIERVMMAAQRAGVQVSTPRPGESFEPGAAPAPDRWWPQLPWKTADQAPVVSTHQ